MSIHSLSISNFKHISNYIIVTIEGKEPLADYIRRKIRERPQIDYSIIIPAYNEAKRLPNLLPKAIDVLFTIFIIFTYNQHFEKMKYKYEIIVVSDASKDKTYYF